MTTIKATCPLCGEVSLTSEDITLRIGPERSTNTYSFSCPDCGEVVEKPATERVVRLLLSGGVVPTLTELPAEALEPKQGPPICYDDLLEFHEMLKGEDWLDALIDPQRN